MRRFAFLFLALLLSSPLASAQERPEIPNFWDTNERFVRPNLQGLPRLRFLTVTDFPPFAYIDETKRLSGFHVDLARAICAELGLSSVCQIQALPFGELESALNAGVGEAIMAGIPINAVTRTRFSFSRPYFRLPARFIARGDSQLSEPLVSALGGEEVGIVDGTAHAAFARERFSTVRLRLFDTMDSALAALEKGDVKAVFGDGLALAFWQQQRSKDLCCTFVGGPYHSEVFFGRGLTIAAGAGNKELEDGLNYALNAINDKGTFAELYLRYFPISLY